MKKFIQLLFTGLLLFSQDITGQTVKELVEGVKTKMAKVNDYEATGKMKTNVSFIKAPIANVKVYFRKPDKLRVKNENGVSFIPKGSVNINLGNIFSASGEFDIIDAGRESPSGLQIVKLLPRNENSDVVLSTLYIDEKRLLVIKARTTTRDNGSYELSMTYGKYADYGLADKVIFSFNIKEYKLPKGVTFDYDDGSKKESTPAKDKNGKGTVELNYSGYVINKGVPDAVFQ